MRYAYHNASKEGDLSRILFYSVLLHYLVFYILFGNPFLIQKLPSGGTSLDRFFDVQLLSPPEAVPPGAPKPEAVRLDETRSGTKVSTQETMTEEEFSRLFQVPEGFRKEVAGVAPKPLPLAKNVLNEGINVVDTLTLPPEADQLVVPEKKVKDLPPNVNGPEDCLLKVVGMVCPNGDAACIADYKEFCASLPK